MNLKVGDKVRIKENLSECEFGHNPLMDEYIGKEAIIVRIWGEGMILLDIDGQDWNWSEKVLEEIEGDKVKMKRIDYVLNSKDPIKVLAEEFKLDLDCRQCYYEDSSDCPEDCEVALKKYLEQEIGVDKSDLKAVNVSVEATDETIDTNEVLQKALDEVKEQLFETKGKIINMEDVSFNTEGYIVDLDDVKEETANPFMEEYEKIVLDTMKLCIAKNKDYGSSVQDTYNKFGDVSYLVRITDKYNRICTLLDKEAEVKDESIDDTIRDMANYCFLWLASRKLNK